jgi:hypothetical protein
MPVAMYAAYGSPLHARDQPLRDTGTIGLCKMHIVQARAAESHRSHVT